MATRGQIFFVVGHKRWGKSSTLRQITDEVHQVRTVQLGDRSFFIRRMSNDDRPEEWEAFVQPLDPAETSHLIIALCPTLKADPFLAALSERYALFFWVMRHQYGGSGEIKPEEEARLAMVGRVEVYTGHDEAAERAARLQRFILANP